MSKDEAQSSRGEPDNLRVLAGLLNRGIKAVPRVGYAAGVVGVGAATAILNLILRLNKLAIISVVAMFVAMILLYVFSRIEKARDPIVRLAGQAIVAVVTLAFSGFVISSLWATIGCQPRPLVALYGLDAACGADKAETQIEKLANRIDFKNLQDNKNAIASLQGIAMTGQDAKTRDEVVAVLKAKLNHRSTIDYDTLSRSVRKAILDAVIRIRNFDIHRDFLDDQLATMDLAGADFRNVNLQGISFNNSFIIDVDFRGANLRQADLSSTSLRNVRFHDADLNGAKLQEADWYNARGLTESQLRSVEIKTIRGCPIDNAQRPSREAFIDFADAHYGIGFDGWTEEERKETVRAWTEYMRPGGLCALVRSFAFRGQ